MRENPVTMNSLNTLRDALCKDAHNGQVQAIFRLKGLALKHHEPLNDLRDIVLTCDHASIRRKATDVLVEIAGMEGHVGRISLHHLKRIVGQSEPQDVQYCARALMSHPQTQKGMAHPNSQELHALLEAFPAGEPFAQAHALAEKMNQDKLADGLDLLRQKFGNKGGGQGRSMGKMSDPRQKPSGNWTGRID